MYKLSDKTTSHTLIHRKLKTLNLKKQVDASFQYYLVYLKALSWLQAKLIKRSS